MPSGGYCLYMQRNVTPLTHLESLYNNVTAALDIKCLKR